MKKALTVIFFLLISLIPSREKIFSGEDLTLLHIACDGRLGISSGQEIEFISVKKRLGNIQGGLLWRDVFFAIETNSSGHKELIGTNLRSKKTSYLMNLNGALDDNYFPWGIGYVDEKQILLGAYKYESDVPIEKQRRHANIYQINRHTKTITKLPIADCYSIDFSFHRGQLYYTSLNGNIHKFNGDNSQSLSIKGRFPSVSPDGSKLAYASSGFFFENIRIYDLKTNNYTTVLKIYSTGSVWPIIRWSSNSRYIAVQKKSDLGAQPLYIVDVLNKDIVSKSKKATSCNWFFVEDGNWKSGITWLKNSIFHR